MGYGMAQVQIGNRPCAEGFVLSYGPSCPCWIQHKNELSSVSQSCFTECQAKMRNMEAAAESMETRCNEQHASQEGRLSCCRDQSLPHVTAGVNATGAAKDVFERNHDHALVYHAE